VQERLVDFQIKHLKREDLPDAVRPKDCGATAVQKAIVGLKRTHLDRQEEDGGSIFADDFDISLTKRAK